MKQVAEALDQAYARAMVAENAVARTVDVATARYIIFSDQHRGVRNGADDFCRCERAYNAALAYYNELNYTLVELGDVEDLWEESPGPVLAAYQRSFELSAQFLREDDRYLRIWGNHDRVWSSKKQVHRHLSKVLNKDLEVYESVLLDVVAGNQELGKIWLTHGHQGSTESDQFSYPAQLAVRFVWQPLQRLLKKSLNTPAKAWSLRERQNIALYSWAASKPNLVLIAGHTHRPVFESKLLATRKAEELRATRIALQREQEDAQLQTKAAKLSAELEWIRAQDQAEPGREGESYRLIPFGRPCYFNTGCSSFADGDVTGIELADGEIRLVRWPNNDRKPAPEVLESCQLSEVFAKLQEPTPQSAASEAADEFVHAEEHGVEILA
jgi:UDP-2,3-diacylglucosamine pyrophosphatase LpxH